MKFHPKILFAVLVAGFSAEAKAQSAQHKKATASQTFFMTLTRPAATQVDMANTANNYLANKTAEGKSAAAVSNGSSEANINGFTVTDVKTESKEPENVPATNTVSVPQPNLYDRVQIITMSKA